MKERVQKILANAGFGSRRKCEEIIRAGRVRVNGQIICLGTKADAARDKVFVDGNFIQIKPRKNIYIALNKPRGVLSDNNPEDGRDNVFDLVGMNQHLFAIGRLDLDSEGLIILTNDGILSNLLTHPRYEHDKEYHVLVGRKPAQEQLMTWRRGIVLDDGYRTAPVKVSILSESREGAWLKVIMHEGRKRQIREVGEKLGLPVRRIIRTRISSISLDNLKPGEWRYLDKNEIEAINGQVYRYLNKTTSKLPSNPGDLDLI